MQVLKENQGFIYTLEIKEHRECVKTCGNIVLLRKMYADGIVGDVLVVFDRCDGLRCIGPSGQ